MSPATVPCQYRTGKTLSSGTHFTLKEALHIKTGRYYTCKIIDKSSMKGKEHLVRNEIAVLKRVRGRNPNIVKLHDYFQTVHSIYLCLDLCTGPTLWDRIRTKGTYSEAIAVDLVRTLFVAVKHIHSVDVVHRNLRPENLLFRTPDEGAPIMITDLGLSRMMEDAPHPDGDIAASDAFRYMAPEILLKTEQSKPVDVWGLGLLAFFILAGCTPFERDSSDTELEAQAVVAGEYKFVPEDDWDKVSLNARDFIALCLAKDPKRRPTAGEALAHTWLVPATPRFALRTSRTNSLLDLSRIPYWKRVFNPKRKWRIWGLTIKALNRMHNLAERHRHNPAEQEAYRQDSQTTYYDLHAPNDTADFPSPVSSVFSFSDEASWLTRDSVSTASTDEDMPAEIDDDSSQESVLEFSVDNLIQTEGCTDEQTRQDTSQFSSTASSVSDKNVEEAVGAESSTSPQDAAGPPISTFVIYTPDKLSKDRVAVTPEDVQVIENSFAEGGLVVSAHRPTQAEAWVEDHYDDHVFQTSRSTGLRGPIAAMLSPGVPALAIFGSFLDDRVLSFAKTLADVSGFTVMIRPIGDDPVSKFSGLSGSDETLPGISSTLGAESEEEDEDEHESGADRDGGLNDVQFQHPNPSGTSLEGPALRLRGGRGDDSDEDDGQIPWISKAHRAAVWLKFWPDEKHEYALSVRTQTRFQLQSQYPEENVMETQPEVIGRVSLKVETRARVLPDRSYTSLGFLAHRQNCVTDREFINCGFDHPDQIRKSVDQRTSGWTASASGGYMNLHPTAGGGITYSKTRAKTVELADNKPTPRCLIIPDPGEHWNKDGKSYISYDITAVPGADPTTGIKHPLKADFAMGINIDPSQNAGIPKISFITRNQVIMWISDPSLKSKVRGLLVLMTTYIPNIRTRQEFVVKEELDVHFSTDNAPQNNPPPPPAPRDMALSLSIGPIKTKKSRKNSISEFFTDVRRKLSTNKEPILAYLPLQEYISRGWDANNETWRSAIWTSLDKDFRNTNLEMASTSPAWKLGWNPRRQEEHDSDDPDEGEMAGNDVVHLNPVAEVINEERREREIDVAELVAQPLP